MTRETFEINEELPQTDVAVVGAGPVGLMLANLLGLAGVRVAVCERNPGLFGLPRAIVYDAETLRLFSQIGLYDRIEPGLIENPHVRYLNARGAILMEADLPHRSPYGHSALGTFYQPDFEKVLLAGLSRFPHAAVHFGGAVTGVAAARDDVSLTVESPQGDRRLRAKYVVGCDGGASSIRDMIGAKLIGSTYAERWLVVDAIVKNHEINQISFYCDPRRPRVELPAVGERVRWEFMQLRGESEDDLERENTVRDLVLRHTKYRDFEIERKAVYTFHARVADRWRSGRVFLAGDAAHLMPPFAGQGMNGGLKDTVNLAWKLAAILRGEAQEPILDTYETERSRVVRGMVEVSRRLGAIIMPTNRAAAAARDAAFAALNLSAAFRGFIGRGGFMPPPAVRRSALTGVGKDSLIGQMLPQPLVSYAGETRPLDQILDCHQWLALGFAVDPVSLLSKRDLSILDGLGARFASIDGASRDGRTLALKLEDAGFRDWAQRNRLKAVLVRPDRFIADRLDPQRDLAVLSLFSAAQTGPLPRLAA